MNIEDELIGRALNGSRDAFQQLLERYYDMIYRVAYRLSGNTQDAEDIAQEVAIKIAGKLKLFQQKSSFSTWLYKITLNTYRDFCKQMASKRKIDDSYIEYEHMERLNNIDSKHKIAVLYRHISTLEPVLKETALLILSEDLSHAQAAKIMECAESTISWRMHEIRKKLKVMLDGNQDE